MTACPYDARTLVQDDVTSFEGVVLPNEEESSDRLNSGKMHLLLWRCEKRRGAMCTVHCPGQCRIFGDVDDPESEISKYIKEKNAVRVEGTHIWYGSGGYAR